jgi:hypothetical protein
VGRSYQIGPLQLKGLSCSLKGHDSPLPFIELMDILAGRQEPASCLDEEAREELEIGLVDIERLQSGKDLGPGSERVRDGMLQDRFERATGQAIMRIEGRSVLAGSSKGFREPGLSRPAGGFGEGGLNLYQGVNDGIGLGRTLRGQDIRFFKYRQERHDMPDQRPPGLRRGRRGSQEAEHQQGNREKNVFHQAHCTFSDFGCLIVREVPHAGQGEECGRQWSGCTFG